MALGLQAIRPRNNAVIDIAQVGREVPSSLNNYLLRVQKRLQVYPPQQQPTDYVRTGTLGRGWQVKVRGNEGTLVNRTGYAVFVQGPHPGKVGGRQAKVMRRKGWKSITEVSRETKKEFRGIVNKAVRGRPGAG